MWIQFRIRLATFRFILLTLFIFLISKAVWCETGDNLVWQKIETKHTKIYYKKPEDLVKFDRQIKYGPDQWALKRLFSNKDSEELSEFIRKKVDALYERVQEILDMRKKIKKVHINIYANQKELHNAFQKIYNKPCKLRAWYIFEYHTIYLNVEDLHEGMLAHEIAHSVIDHFLTVRPPKASAEILARYVDSHLK